MTYPPDLEPLFNTDEKAIGVMRERFGLPDLDIKVHVITAGASRGWWRLPLGWGAFSCWATPPTAIRRRVGAEQRGPRCAQPVLEAGRGAPGNGR
jgi:hypothetical protein